MIEIVFKDSDTVHYYNPDQYTDYRYDRKFFIVIRDKQWIGFYNLDCVEYIKVEPNNKNWLIQKYLKEPEKDNAIN